MVSIYSVKRSEIEGKGKFLVELRGLSTDEKPTTLNNGDVENGSVFIEIDTGDVYLYNEDDTEWLPVVEEVAENSEE